MTTETTISLAQDAARNPHACSHVNAAHARLIAFLIENQPPAFTLHPMADQFENASKFLRDFASVADDLAYQIAREANANARSHISTVDRVAIFSDALHDSDLSAELDQEAYALETEAA